MEVFLYEWNVKFGPGVKPPEWVFSLGLRTQQPENVGREVVECAGRVDKLKQELDKELFLLSWLRKLKGSSGGEDDRLSPYLLGHVLEEDVFVNRSNEKTAKDTYRAREVAHTALTSIVEVSKDSYSPEPALACPPSRCEDSPNSSEYYTAGRNSSSDTTSLSYYTEEEPSPVSTRQRFVHNVTSKDIEVAKLVKHKVIEEGRHWSCLNLSQVTLKGEELVLKPSLTGRHKRFHSAPAFEFEQVTQQRPSNKSQKRVWSTSCGVTARNGIVVSSGSLEQPPFSLSQPLEASHPTVKTEQVNQPPSDRENPNTAISYACTSDSINSGAEFSYVRRVVLRDKSKLSNTLSMANEEELGQWKGSVRSSSFAGKRSSNSILDSMESYNFKHSEDGGDNDPALLNVMASRIRGTLQSPRMSVKNPSLALDPVSGTRRQTSPNLEVRHIPISGLELDPISSQGDEGSSSKHFPPFLVRRNTDASSVKRDRFSYHYSDDECTTPKVDTGDPMTFTANTPLGSRGCSHRNSRSSNGILDEETTTACDLTLKWINFESVARDDRKNTITATDERGLGDEKRRSTENGESLLCRRDGDDEKESSLTTTLTDHNSIKKSTDIFEESSFDCLPTFGGLNMDIESTFSKFKDTPEMSMAGLLDTKENQQMNAAHPSFKKCLDTTPEDSDYLESIEIDDATISAFTLTSNLYGSRCNSASSLPGLYSDTSGASSSSPPEQESPTHSSSSSMAAAASAALHGVNLRHSGGRRWNRKRMCNADLEAFSVERGGEDVFAKSPSISSTSLTSEEEFYAPMSPQQPDAGESLLSPGSRMSRLYPIRHSTVVVHGGEPLVIRKLVVVGVASAEKSYIECLSVAKEYYRKPLLALTTVSQPIIPEKDINTIFFRIDDLHLVHKTLHEQLMAVLRDWSVCSCVGDFFVQLCRNLKLYKEYVEMYQKAVECLNRNKAENPLFKKFIVDVHATVTKTNTDIPRINELLRRPIERLQSYSLVLNDLCQHTPKDHSDYRILRESLQAMSAFIASTHDPQAFRELSGGYNREMVKEGLVVELSEGIRKVRRLFLFHDVLVSAKQKQTRASIKFEPKWCLSLNEISFKCPEGMTKKPVLVSSELEMSVMKNKIAELKAQMNSQNSRDRDRAISASGDGFNIRRNIFMIKYGSTKQSEKTKKKLQEQQVCYWVASPSLPLRLFDHSGSKQFMFLLHNEEEKESWISSIKKLIPKSVANVSLTPFELQDLLSRQTINDLQKVEEMIVPTADEEYLNGVLHVRVIAATELKAKQAGLYCCLELDEYGKFERKARTLPTNTDNVTLITTWDQNFELELVGSHNLKILICSKSLLKEETYAMGKIRLPIKELKQKTRQRLKVSLAPQGFISLIIEYFANMASVIRRATMQSSGVFGVPIEVVAKRERHDIPLIVQTCVDEVEKRGLTEIGVYRIVGVLRDVEELRQSFDSDYLKAQMIAYDIDIHAVAGLLKRYFRELPDPLFTEALYMNFVHALGLSDPEARAQCLVSLLHSLPPVNLKTAIFLFKHLRRVGANAKENKMTLTNLATVFGPNLLHPGISEPAHLNMMAMDVVTPVSVVLYYLNCPDEFFDEIQTASPENTANPSGGSGGRRNSEVVGEAAIRDETGDATPRVVLREKTRDADGDLPASQKGFRRSRRSSARGTPRNSGTNVNVRAVASFRASPSSSSVRSSTPSRESII